MVGQCLAELEVIGIANVADGGQRGLLLAVAALSDVLDEGSHELWPLIAGYFDGGNRGNELGGRTADSPGGSGECAQSHLLDLLLDLGAQVDPSVLDLT